MAGRRFSRIVLGLLALAALLSCSPVRSDDSPEALSAQGLAERITGFSAHKFAFRKIESPDGKDLFRIESKRGKILISGNSALSMSKGLGYYLKYYCNLTPGWFEWDTIEMPSSLPTLDEPIEVHARVQERFFLNYCTFGYTMPWWKWDQWEHMIDWMALQGINLPLAITGQESIWYEVWKDLGLDRDRIRDYFTGPAHLPWHRMLNIDRWGGPLPESWLEGQANLQKLIVDRERELGMTPVLPAFAGHVPDFLAETYPDARITKMGSWCDFPEEDVPSFLDPMDPLFPRIQKLFLEKERQMYGTDHIYGIDLFNEMTPPGDTPEYLERVSRQVYESLRDADPDGVWLQMTWLFWNERAWWTKDRIEPYITAVPKDRSILLDYYCERQEVWQKTDRYFGMPYIWCYLGNFGGNTYLIGDLVDVNKRIENTFENGGDNFIGIGSTLESFDCNPFMYEFIFDKAWDNPQNKDPKQYTSVIAKCRTESTSPEAEQAWSRIVENIYHSPSSPGQSPEMNLRPSLVNSSSYHSSRRFTYSNEELRSVIDLLLQCGGKGSAYRFDLVNLTRQYVSNRFEQIFAMYKDAYQERDTERMGALSRLLLGYFDHEERILSTQDYFLVGRWISDARSWGTTPGEELFFERNARNLLTTWGDRGNILTDYANRTWAGLVSSYYRGRWRMFFAEVRACMRDHGSFTEKDEAALLEKIMDFETAWWKKCEGSFSPTPIGDSIEEVRAVLSAIDSEKL